MEIAQHDLILQLYNTGIGMEAIERQTGICVEAANKVLLHIGIDTSADFKRRKQEKLQKGLELYNSGMQFKRVCKEVGISPNTLRPFLKTSAGHWKTQKESLVNHMDNSEEAILRRSSENRRYPLDETVFDDLNNPNTAYWIGFIYSDGSISCEKGKYRIAIGLAQKDYEHLVKWCNFLKTPTERVKYVQSNKSYQVIICSYTLNKKLQELGFDNQKSYTCKVPEVYKDNPNFWRGVVDGDGSLMNFKTEERLRRKINLVGTEATVTSFRTFLSQKGLLSKKIVKKANAQLWSVSYSSLREVLLIGTLLYANANTYLDRKYEIYQEWLKEN